MDLRFGSVVSSFNRPVSTIFQPYIILNGTYERIKKFSDTLPLRNMNEVVRVCIALDPDTLNNVLLFQFA